MKLKVCGLSNPIEVDTCVSHHVDYCGFILNYPKSHRSISLERAKNLTQEAYDTANEKGFKDIGSTKLDITKPQKQQ